MATKEIDWVHDDCPECGGAVKVLTGAPQDDVIDGQIGPFAYDGDRWKCEDGHEGVISCDGESPATLELAY